MFKAECEKIVKYDLQISEDIIKFCQWVLEEDEVLDDIYSAMDLLDCIANKAHHYEAPNGEINIEYE